MTFNPGVEFFVSFYDLDPCNKRCIYFTKYNPPTRCKWPCDDDDYTQTLALRENILSCSDQTERVRLIRDYVLHNCCRRGIYESARHRLSMERDGLLIPLVQRWIDEIRSHVSTQQRTAPEQETGIDDLLSSLTITQPGDCSSSSNISLPLSQRIGSLSSPRGDLSSSSSSIEVSLNPRNGKERYGMRPRETDDSVSSIIGEMSKLSIFQQPLSEFCPHISDPLPRDSVWAKLSSDLQRRDFETGALYIFERDGSPGYVKIGWTAVSLESRRKDWSTHGYEPRFLFKLLDVPYAQRVETLTHFELIKEWRQEVKCRAENCQVRHQEWFEVTKDKAQQVLGDWADFMVKAQPYNKDGSLVEKWRKIIDAIEEKGEVITAARMMEHIDVSFADESTLVEESVDLNPVPHAGHAHNLENQRLFGENKASDMPRGSLLAGTLEKVSSQPQHFMAMSNLPTTQVTLSQAAEKQPLGKLVLEPEHLPSTQLQFETNTLASTPLTLPTIQAQQKPLPSFESLLNEGSSEITNIKSSNQSVFAGKPLFQTTSQSTTETSKSTTNSSMGFGKDLLRFDSLSKSEPLFRQSHSLNDPSGKPMFQFGSPLEIEDETPAPFSFQFGKTPLESKISPRARSAPVLPQSSISQTEDLLFRFGSPPKTNSTPPKSVMFPFGKPLLPSTMSFETGSHPRPSQSSDALLEKRVFQFDSSSKPEVGIPVKSSVQPETSAFQFGCPQTVASAKALQPLSARVGALTIQSSTSSMIEQSSAESTLPTAHSLTGSLQLSQLGPPWVEEVTSLTTVSPGTESSELLLQTASLSKSDPPERVLRTSVPARSLFKTELASQQPQPEKTPQPPKEKTAFQFGSSSNAILPFKVEVPSGLPSPFTRDSIFQFRASSTVEPISKGKTASNIQNPFTENLVSDIGAPPEFAKAYQPESTLLQPTKAPLFRFGFTNKSEARVNETRNWRIGPGTSEAVHALEASKNSDEISQTISISSTGHGPNSRSEHEEALVQGTDVDKGILSPSEIPPPVRSALEIDAALAESERRRLPLQPSPYLQTGVGSASSPHEDESVCCLETGVHTEAEKIFSNRVEVELGPEHSVLDSTREITTRISGQGRQSAHVKSQNERPTENMMIKNDDQLEDRGKITADDDAVTDDGLYSVSDGEQTLVDNSEPKMLEQAASKLVAQLFNEVSTKATSGCQNS